MSTPNPQLTAKLITSFLGLAWDQNLALAPDFVFGNIQTDSRKIQKGDLFVALVGEQFDGHDFIDKALQLGASGVLCQKGRGPQSVLTFEVPDTLEAYRTLARQWRAQFNIPVLCVAGSVGKTTTKELLAAILSGKYHSILKTEGSQNGFVGIPMTLLELRAHHQIAVIEVGIDEIGAMHKHLPLVAPQGTLLTAIGPEHLEKLIDLPTVAHEEGLALSFTHEEGGWVAINLNDPWIRPFFEKLASPKNIGFGLQTSDLQLSALQSSTAIVLGSLGGEPLSPSLTCNGAGLEAQCFKLPLPGTHNALNTLGAIAMALRCGLSAPEIQKGLASFSHTFGRSDVRVLPGQTHVLCDYYNANPASMQAAFKVLASFTAQKRFVCLGDMLELGPDELRFHQELARPLLAAHVDSVFLLGPRMKALAAELRAQKFKGHVQHFQTHAEMAQALLAHFAPGDALLLKGSRGMKMEEVWNMFEPAFLEASS